MEHPRRLSGLVDSILAAHPDGDTITIIRIVDHLGARAYGPLLLLFAAPNLIPNIPGSGLLSAPLLPLSIQMAQGNVPWLPARLARKPITRSALERLAERTRPWLARADRLVRPRWRWLTAPLAERVLGAYVALLAFVLFLPIPLANMLPSWAVALIGVGVLERDGLWVALGVLVGLLSLAVAATVVVAAGSVVAGVVA